MNSKAETEYRYEKRTWPEIDDAIELGKVCILPCGAIEQHGPQVAILIQVSLVQPNLRPRKKASGPMTRQ